MTDYNSPDELLAVVDENDREIGAQSRRLIHERKLLHRAVHVLVYDKDENLLIQKRSAKKDTYPLHWECVGGHLGPGEKYQDAAIRELDEELGLPPERLERLRKLDACEATGFEFIEIYRVTALVPPLPHPDEIIEIDWVSPEVLRRQFIADVRKFSPIFLNTLRAVRLHM
jgi:isopentenyl-diphosphate Delta-isomerase